MTPFMTLLTTGWHQKGHFWRVWQKRVENHLVRKCAESQIRTRPQSKLSKVVNFVNFGVFWRFSPVSFLTEVLTCGICRKHWHFGVFQCIPVLLDYWPKPRSGHGSLQTLLHWNTPKTPLLDTFWPLLDTKESAMLGSDHSNIRNIHENYRKVMKLRKLPKSHQNH